jgi:hypothetical protein
VTLLRSQVARDPHLRLSLWPIGSAHRASAADEARALVRVQLGERAEPDVATQGRAARLAMPIPDWG